MPECGTSRGPPGNGFGPAMVADGYPERAATVHPGQACEFDVSRGTECESEAVTTRVGNMCEFRKHPDD